MNLLNCNLELKMNTIKKNFAYNAIYQILIIILPIVTAPYVSRVLGPTRMGQYSYTYSIATYFLLLAKLGFDNYGNRSIARSRNNGDDLNRTFTGIYSLQILIAIGSIVLYLVYTFTFSKYYVLALIQGLWVLGALFDVNWFFYGLEQFSIVVLRNTLVKVISVILIFTLVRQSSDLWKYTLILAASSVIGFLITWPFIFSKISIVKVSFSEIFSHFKQTALLFIPVIAISVFTVLDKIMLGHMGSLTQVGYFEAAEKVMMAPKGIIGALGTVMLPRMANVYSNRDTKNKSSLINISIGFALVFSIACMFGLIGVSKTFVPIFFGAKYMATISVLILMSLALPFYAIGNIIRTQMLIPNMRDKPYIISVILGAVANISLNLLLIPIWGARGSVIATLAAEITIAVSQLLAVLNELQFRKFAMVMVNSIVSSGVMLVFIYFIANNFGQSLVSLLLQVLVGGGMFLIVFLILARYSKDDIIRRITQSILHRNI
ncbi:flippase [Lactiplantibacillus brownii]